MVYTHTLSSYSFIYIYMCVCVCMCLVIVVIIIFIRIIFIYRLRASIRNLFLLNSWKIKWVSIMIYSFSAVINYETRRMNVGDGQLGITLLYSGSLVSFTGGFNQVFFKYYRNNELILTFTRFSMTLVTGWQYSIVPKGYTLTN